MGDGPDHSGGEGVRSQVYCSASDLWQVRGRILEEIQKFVADILSDRTDLTTIVELEGTCLKVIIQTTEFLDGQNLAAEFGRKLSPIASNQIHRHCNL